MMDDRDELLVSKFFDENKIDVADNGFSRRVTRRLPDRERRLNRIWTAVCLALGAVLAVLFDWLGALVDVVCVLAAAVKVNPEISDRPYLLWLLLFAVIFLGGYKVLAEE